MTCPVTARKRARPISPPGRCQPKGGYGRLRRAVVQEAHDDK